MIERLAPYVLLLLATGAAYLAIAALVRLRPEHPEFWLLGVGVRSRAGASRVLVAALLLLALGYSLLRRHVVDLAFNPSQPARDEQLESQQQQLARASQQIAECQDQMAALTRQKEACQQIVSRQELGMAKTGDVAAELRASLNLRHRDIGALQSTLIEAKSQLAALRNENERLTQVADLSKEQLGQLDSQLEVLKNEKTSLALKLEAASKASESENARLKEENSKLKTQYRDQDRRARLLRQGLVLREANDWALEQEIQRLANLLSDQPEVNTPRQTDISRSLQRINQVLREGQGLTKQAKIADSQPGPTQEKPPSATVKSK